MRMIHAVRFHEKFVASGVYTHHLDDKPAEDIEQWSIHELPDGSQMFRVDREIEFADETNKAHVVMLFEALRSPLGSGGRFEHLDAHCLYDFSPDKKGQVRLSCAFFATQAIAQRQIDSEETQHYEFNFDEDYVIVFWDSALLMGLSVAEAYKHKYDEKELIPAVRVAGGWNHLKSDLLLRIGQPVLCTFPGHGETDTFAIGDKRVVGQSYWLMVNLKGDEIVAWLDSYDVLLKKVNEHSPKEDYTLLTQYARRAEPPTP